MIPQPARSDRTRNCATTAACTSLVRNVSNLAPSTASTHSLSVVWSKSCNGNTTTAGAIRPAAISWSRTSPMCRLTTHRFGVPGKPASASTTG